MENLTPIQHFAHELRESFKREEQEKQRRQINKLEIEEKELIIKFAGSFSSLFSLLISSNIEIQAQVNHINRAVLLIYQQNRISISQDRAIGQVNNWSLFDKMYKATVPNKDFGMASDKTDEHKLIIAIEENLFRPQPAISAQAMKELPV